MIYVAYISVFLRIVPLVLQIISFARGGLGSLYFLAFSFFSFGADVIGMCFTFFNIHSDVVFNIYQIFETIIATCLVIQIGKFKPRIKYILYSFCVFFVMSFVLNSVIYNFDFPQDFNWGLSRFYILVITFISALHYVRKMDSFNSIKAAPLFGLLGIFIYEALSLIPVLSQKIQIESDNPARTYVVYFVFIVSGNLIRDALISCNAVLNINKKII